MQTETGLSFKMPDPSWPKNKLRPDRQETEDENALA
jgi:hypothetical protein